MGSHNVFDKEGLALANNSVTIPDPVTNGATMVADAGKAFQVCVVDTTAGGRDIRLPDPVDYPLGAQILVILDVDGGNLVVTAHDDAADLQSGGADEATMADAGDSLLLHVAIKAGTKQWRVIGNDGASIA